MAQFGSTSSLLGSFCVSVYVLGFAAGPLLFAPLSELYGRQYVYHGCNLGFIGKSSLSHPDRSIGTVAVADRPSLS